MCAKAQVCIAYYRAEQFENVPNKRTHLMDALGTNLL